MARRKKHDEMAGDSGAAPASSPAPASKSRKRSTAAADETAVPAAAPRRAAPPVLSRLAGNARVRNLLTRALTEDRLLPAMLFHGPPGVGKFTAAWAVGAAVLCRGRTPEGACGACPACAQTGNWSHPDLRVLEPEAAAERAGRPVFYPPETSSRADSPRLLVEQVRRMLRETAFRPFAGEHRVILVRDLETDPTWACSHTLLKALEEPPPGTMFILVSSRPDRLPATIRSRCPSLPFMPLSREEVTAFLVERGLPEAEARLRAALSGGCPGTALGLDLEHEQGLIDEALKALESAASGPAEALDAADALPASREEWPRVAAVLTRLARDLLVTPHAGDAALLLHEDRGDRIAALAERMGEARAAALLARLAWCEEVAERNVSPSLMLETALLEAGGSLPIPALDAPLIATEET